MKCKLKTYDKEVRQRNFKNSKRNRFRSVINRFSVLPSRDSLPEHIIYRQRAGEEEFGGGAATGHTTIALDASPLHSNGAALRKRVLRARSRNTT